MSKQCSVRLCWPYMKEMKSSDKTGGLLKPRGPVCWCHTHTHTHTHTYAQEQNSPGLVPASHQMAHLLRPSAQRDARLVVPTDRQPNSPHAPWQAGAVTAPLVEDQMLIAARSRRSAATHPPRKDCLSLHSIMTQTYKLTSRSAFGHCDALRCQIWTTSLRRPMFHWQRPLLCHSMRTVLKWRRKLIKKRTAEDGISDEGCGELSAPDKAELCSSNFTVRFYFYWTDWVGIAAKAIKASMYMRT